MKSLTSKILVAASLALTLSAAQAAMPVAGDEALAQAAKKALSHKTFPGSVRVQAIDGVVYLYGRTATYAAQIDAEEAVKKAVDGHKVVSSIEGESNR